MLLMVVMFAFASFAVDWGRVQLVQTELERAADSAARAGISQLSGGVTAVRNAVVTFGANNKADNTNVVIDPVNDVEFGSWNSVARTFTVLPDTSGANAIRITARRTAARGNPVPLTFGAIVGIATCDAKAKSTVAIGTTTLDYSAGFSGVTTMSLNGSAVVSGSALQLTTTTNNLGGSAWNTARVPVGSFTTNFSFQITSASADGMTFAIQNNLTTSKGSIAGGLGYSSMVKSVGVKFDIYNNSGEGTTSTGVYVGGASPANIGSFDTTSSGVNFRSGHIMNVSLVYDGTTLTQTITDASTNAVFTHAYVVDIPAATSGSLAYVGFTGATGGASAVQNVLKWTYTATGTYSLVK